MLRRLIILEALIFSLGVEATASNGNSTDMLSSNFGTQVPQLPSTNESSIDAFSKRMNSIRAKFPISNCSQLIQIENELKDKETRKNFKRYFRTFYGKGSDLDKFTRIIFQDIFSHEFPMDCFSTKRPNKKFFKKHRLLRFLVGRITVATKKARANVKKNVENWFNQRINAVKRANYPGKHFLGTQKNINQTVV